MKARWLIGGILGVLLGQTATSQPKPLTGNGLQGDYYNGTNFEQKVFTRTDPQINFDWEWAGSPGPGLGHSYYSIRWTGKLYAPKTGVYLFTAKVDDGIRLWVGGKRVIDVWSLNDSKTFMGEIRLVAGRYYDLRVDFFNDRHGGSISLYWIPPTETLPAYVSRHLLFRPDYKPPRTRAMAARLAEKPESEKPKPRVIVIRETASPARATHDSAVAKAPVKTAERFENLKTGDKLVLNQVNFEQSEYRLLPESYAELDKLVRTMKQNPKLTIEISGHTDNVGDPRLNLALSENRARVIETYLVRNGVDQERIETRGYGGTRPVADNGTEAGRSKNRRVEFVVK
ncbi:PA14 domain-containing protein [Larkinella bovis]|uniref:PA14 domain-containing protein n=1 Tax=Larkinella bovis TaxID=683041 RepID=A0ABW0IBV3_9BACT